MMLHHLYHRKTLEFNYQPRCETWKYFHQRKKKETSWIPRFNQWEVHTVSIPNMLISSINCSLSAPLKSHRKKRGRDANVNNFSIQF